MRLLFLCVKEILYDNNKLYHVEILTSEADFRKCDLSRWCVTCVASPSIRFKESRSFGLHGQSSSDFPVPETMIFMDR